MSLNPSELWSAWRTSPEIQEIAEAWLTKRQGDWTGDDERLYSILHAEPDQALAVIFAAMQFTADWQILEGLAAGPLEDFLGVHGEAYVETFHTLALEHRRLREVLDGVWQGAMPKRVWHRIEILKQSAFS
ncbi:MAG: hypothetical protein KIT22_04645 [Verrucomicrobiae bacterium]|nr:hypothetical protein [Verrucomicrobiae bacterium]